jgi:hypothetical protein
MFGFVGGTTDFMATVLESVAVLGLGVMFTTNTTQAHLKFGIIR